MLAALLATPMTEPKHRGGARGEPEPLEAGLVGPAAGSPAPEEEGPDEYLLLKVVEANGEHLRTMRWGLGLGTLALVLYVAFGHLLQAQIGPFLAGLAVLALAGGLLGVGLQALGRQLELLRRAVAATDRFLFGPPGESEP